MIWAAAQAFPQPDNSPNGSQSPASNSSKAQLELARANVPNAKFIEADMASLTFPEASFDAVTAFYSLTHVPRTQVPALLSRIARWLRPGGLLLATFSSADDPGWMGEWLGQPMFFSGYDAPTNRRLLADAEFEVLIDHDVEIVEPEGPARFLWILAQSRGAQSGTT